MPSDAKTSSMYLTIVKPRADDDLVRRAEMPKTVFGRDIKSWINGYHESLERLYLQRNNPQLDRDKKKPSIQEKKDRLQSVSRLSLSDNHIFQFLQPHLAVACELTDGESEERKGFDDLSTHIDQVTNTITAQKHCAQLAQQLGRAELRNLVVDYVLEYCTKESSEIKTYLRRTHKTDYLRQSFQGHVERKFKSGLSLFAATGGFVMTIILLGPSMGLAVALTLAIISAVTSIALVYYSLQSDQDLNALNTTNTSDNVECGVVSLAAIARIIITGFKRVTMVFSEMPGQLTSSALLMRGVSWLAGVAGVYFTYKTSKHRLSKRFSKQASWLGEWLKQYKRSILSRLELAQADEALSEKDIASLEAIDAQQAPVKKAYLDSVIEQQIKGKRLDINKLVDRTALYQAVCEALVNDDSDKSESAVINTKTQIKQLDILQAIYEKGCVVVLAEPPSAEEEHEAHESQIKAYLSYMGLDSTGTLEWLQTQYDKERDRLKTVNDLSKFFKRIFPAYFAQYKQLKVMHSNYNRPRKQTIHNEMVALFLETIGVDWDCDFKNAVRETCKLEYMTTAQIDARRASEKQLAIGLAVIGAITPCITFWAFLSPVCPLVVAILLIVLYVCLSMPIDAMSLMATQDRALNNELDIERKHQAGDKSVQKIGGYVAVFLATTGAALGRFKAALDIARSSMKLSVPLALLVSTFIAASSFVKWLFTQKRFVDDYVQEHGSTKTMYEQLGGQVAGSDSDKDPSLDKKPAAKTRHTYTRKASPAVSAEEAIDDPIERADSTVGLVLT